MSLQLVNCEMYWKYIWRVIHKSYSFGVAFSVIYTHKSSVYRNISLSFSNNCQSSWFLFGFQYNICQENWTISLPVPAGSSTLCLWTWSLWILCSLAFKCRNLLMLSSIGHRFYPLITRALLNLRFSISN